LCKRAPRARREYRPDGDDASDRSSRAATDRYGELAERRRDARQRPALHVAGRADSRAVHVQHEDVPPRDRAEPADESRSESVHVPYGSAPRLAGEPAAVRLQAELA